MKCRGCGEALLLNARFCSKCGMSVAIAAAGGSLDSRAQPDIGVKSGSNGGMNSIEQDIRRNALVNNAANSGWVRGQGYDCANRGYDCGNGGYQQYRNYASAGARLEHPWQSPPPRQNAPSYAKRSNDMATVGFVLSIAAPLLGLIFSCIALSRANKRPGAPGRGLAIAGIAISISLMCISLLGNILNIGTELPYYLWVPGFNF